VAAAPIARNIVSLFQSGATGVHLCRSFLVSRRESSGALFDDDFFQSFYGNSFYQIYSYDAETQQPMEESMAAHKGSGSFMALVLFEPNPESMFVSGKGLVSKRIYELKHAIRKWLQPCTFCLHASQSPEEAAADYAFLFGPQESMLPRSSNGGGGERGGGACVGKEIVTQKLMRIRYTSGGFPHTD
jgi:hypothetical protein